MIVIRINIPMSVESTHTIFGWRFKSVYTYISLFPLENLTPLLLKLITAKNKKPNSKSFIHIPLISNYFLYDIIVLLVRRIYNYKLPFIIKIIIEFFIRYLIKINSVSHWIFRVSAFVAKYLIINCQSNVCDF